MMIERAITLAAKAHEGQVDKAGVPYILHPLRVMLSFSAPEMQVAAVLHDVVEDTGVTLDDLREWGYPASVVETIDALTRRPGEDYFDFIERAKRHHVARHIKIADVKDNQARLHSGIEGHDSLWWRYQRALAILSFTSLGGRL